MAKVPTAVGERRWVDVECPVVINVPVISIGRRGSSGYAGPGVRNQALVSSELSVSGTWHRIPGFSPQARYVCTGLISRGGVIK